MIPEAIKGGYILLARKLLKSGIMEKPPLYLKLFVWMLLQASFKDHGKLRRGQFFTSYEGMRNAMAYKVGYRSSKPSVKEIRGVTKFLTTAGMIVSTRVTHGMLITILNYDYYQSAQNYEGHNEGQSQGHNEGTILRIKGIRKEKPPDFFPLRERYGDQTLIDSVFQAIASTRKSNKVTDSVLLAQLRRWARYPADQVLRGIRTYLEEDYAADGKDERYLLGIIRRTKVQSSESNSIPKKTKILTEEDIYAN